jgi:hypothetical protein
MNTYPKPDALMDFYYKLESQPEIPDMKEYADNWSLLAAQFAADDRPAMAESCATRYRQYAEWANWMPSAKKVQQGDSFVEYRQMTNAELQQAKKESHPRTV